MFILLPIFDSGAAVAGVSLALLGRHWPGHPPVQALHAKRTSAPAPTDRIAVHESASADEWLRNVVAFLEGRDEALFLLMLEDYALCGSPRREIIAGAVRLMEVDLRVGMFALSWYPARQRVARAGWAGVETLGGTPVLLQAAIWRRRTFIELARGMDPRTSPHGFERLATQRAKGMGIEICAGAMPAPRWVGGHFVDGFDKADWVLPYHNLMHAGRLDPRHEAFLRAEGLETPAAGLGDTIERVARVAGIARVADWVKQTTGRDCGCDARRAALNRRFPYRQA